MSARQTESLHAASFQDPIVIRIAAFLAGVGIRVQAGEVPSKTFLPGVLIDRGLLLVDEKRLTYPGDLLHEAGHLALMPAEARANAGPDPGSDDGFEMAATAWSFAAAIEMKLPLEIVFHEGGYRGNLRRSLRTLHKGVISGYPFLCGWG
jgi:hypothetical protein